MNRIEFDATLDDIVDVNMRLVRRTATHRRRRLQAQWAIGVVVVGVATVALQEQASTALVVAFSLVCGLLAGYLYGRSYDRSFRHSYLQLVSELYGGVGTMRCAFELRENVLWTKTGDTEVSFPWSRRTRVDDTDDSIELWFDPGLAVVRNRGFRTQEDRRAFLEAARRLGSEKAV